MIIGKIFRCRKGELLLIMILGSLSVICTLIWNIVMADIIDTVQRLVMPEIMLICKAVLFLVLGMLLQWAISFFSVHIGEYATHDLRMSFAKKLLLADDRCKDRNLGDVLSNQQNEMEEVSEYITGKLFSFLFDILNFICTLCFLLFYNVKLTLICMIPICISVLYVSISSKLISRCVKKQKQKLGGLNGIINSMVTTFPMIKIFSVEELLTKRYAHMITEWTGAAIAEERRKAMLMTVSGLLSFMPLICMVLVGGHMVFEGSFTMGRLFVFINLSKNVSGVMMNMPSYAAEYRRFSTNAERVIKELEV